MALDKGSGIGRHEAYALDRDGGAHGGLLPGPADDEHGARAVGGALERREQVTTLAIDADARDAGEPLRDLDRLERSRRRDEEPGDDAAEAARVRARDVGGADADAEGGGERERVQVDARSRVHELGIVAAAEP